MNDLYDTGNVDALSAADAGVPHSRQAPALRNMRLLWVVNLDPSVGENHGAGMRFLNFARELSASGAKVYFVVNVFTGDSRSRMETFLGNLKADGVIAEWMITHYSYTPRQGRLGALVLHPGLTNQVLKRPRERVIAEVRGFAERNDITSAVVSDRRMFFLGDALAQWLPTVLDWTDSLALHYWRALLTRVRHVQLGGLFGFLRDYQSNLVSEFYYGRRAHLNTAVSPVDKMWLDRTNFRPERNRLWMNGTKTDDYPSVEKVDKRLIFSGAMDYAPNYEGALWFIDEVLPLIWKRHPDSELIVAGVNPVPELERRAGGRVRITGFVQDLGREIARSSLYVAPLLSGGGFRNKVVEAIMRRTYVVGTPFSAEFLPLEFRQLLGVAENAQEMAEAVIRHLDCPEASDVKLEALRQMVKAHFSWSGRARDLVGFVDEAAANFLTQQGGKR